MKTAILIVIASVHFTGSYFNQSELSSVLSQFEGTLVFPRKKQVDKSASGPGPTTSLGTAAPTPSPASGPGPTTSPETAAPTTEVEVEVELTEVEQSEVEQIEVEQTEVEDGVDGTELEAAVVDRESIVTTAVGPASTSPTGPGSTSTSASSVVTTTASPASTSSTSPGSTSTMPSAMTMTSALTTSKSQQTRMLQVKSGAGWSTKDTMLGLHLGMGLWLLILSGGAMYVGGAISLLWVKLEALQHQRARFPPPPPSVDV